MQHKHTVSELHDSSKVAQHCSVLVSADQCCATIIVLVNSQNGTLERRSVQCACGTVHVLTCVVTWN